MKSRPRSFAGLRAALLAPLLLCSTDVAVAAESAAAKPASTASPAEPVADWIARYRRYLAQPQIPMDYGFGSSDPRAENAQSLRDVLRHLPSPRDWSALRDALHQAGSGAEGNEREQLEAAYWLIGFLNGDRAGVTSAISAKHASQDPMSPTLYSLDNLLQSVDVKPREQKAAEEFSRWFEQQIALFEPIDEAAVKEALGGEENFQRLQKMLKLTKQFQQRAQAIFAEFEKNQDEPAMEQKFLALQTEAETAFADDQQALAKYLEHPTVIAYITQRTANEGGDALEGMKSLHVPNIVQHFGAEKAEQLLRRALVTELSLSVADDAGKETLALARRLALEMADKLKAPQWMLTLDFDGGELFHALDRRFPLAKQPVSHESQGAGVFEVARLLRAGKAKEAFALATALPRLPGASEYFDLPYEAAAEVQKSRPDALWEFERAWLTAQPAGRWTRFLELSVTLDKRKELQEIVAKLAARDDLDQAARLRVDELQANTELAVGDVTAARSRLRGLLTPVADEISRRNQQVEIGRRLLVLSYLENDAAGLRNDLKLVDPLLTSPWKSDELASQFSAYGTLVRTLNSTEEHEAALLYAANALALIPKPATPDNADQQRPHLSTYETQYLLFESLRAFVELGRWDDARTLLHENPHWESGDAVSLLDETVSSSNQPVGWYVARVIERDDPKLARDFLAAQLVAKPGVDAVYRDYARLAGAEADVLLAKLETADRYEERPLIWRARLLIDAGKLDAAQAMLERAIAIDPSDGEQGRGDRMRVYAFLGEVMAKKGDAEKTAFLDGVIAAIRLSEDADRWYDAGVYSRAIDQYRDALTHFADAYCIQSRLAVRLASEGRWPEAETHFRRAFELMPESFGRVESHCFGCENVFTGERPQELAENVFERLLSTQPDRPQLHYLLGYLREEQKRHPEAAASYRRAAELDPLYLNAWKRLGGIAEQSGLGKRERDEIAFRLIELDPAGRHSSISLADVSDIPRLWTLLADANATRQQLPRPAKLYPLTATQKRFDAGPEQGRVPAMIDPPRDGAAIVMEHPFVQSLQNYVINLKTTATTP